jgi:hypothetical protein
VLTRESESDWDEWIPEKIPPLVHASTGAEKQPIVPRNLMIQLITISSFQKYPCCCPYVIFVMVKCQAQQALRVSHFCLLVSPGF